MNIETVKKTDMAALMEAMSAAAATPEHDEPRFVQLPEDVEDGVDTPTPTLH